MSERERLKSIEAKKARKVRAKKIFRLRKKRQAGLPLDIKGHKEKCICYDCLWGDNRELRKEAMKDITEPAIEDPRMVRARYHAP